MYDKLQFRRQFLLTREPISSLDGWQYLQIDQYHLYAHPDLDVNHVSNSNKIIVLLGSLFDAEVPEKGNVDILKDLLIIINNKEDFISRVKRYAGTFAILYKQGQEALILQDARALREVYYCTNSNLIVCGSQPHLVAKYANPEIKKTDNPELIDFYTNYLWDSRWIGDESYFETIKHLLPNHYLDINQLKAQRYWPNEPLKRLSLEEAVHKSTLYLKGIMRAITHRHLCMMAVTAGTDSRTLLAAAKGFDVKIYYFINDHGLGHDNPDITVPKKMFDRIGIPFHVHDVPDEVDEKFRQIYLNNTFLATERILPAIYNVFFKNNGERILILGVSEIGRTFYGKEPKNLNGYRMAYKLGYKQCPYVIHQCEKLMDEMLPVARKSDLNVLALLYWEQRLGNWGGVRNSESLIAIEKVDPFDSHYLYEMFLSVDDKYRSYKQSPCILFREMIHTMWPELLEWPINPSYTLQDKMTWLLDRVGLYELLKELKYRVNYSLYSLKSKNNCY